MPNDRKGSALRQFWKQIVESVATKVIAAVLLLIAGGVAGSVVTLWMSVTVPSGAVIAFDLEEGCPDGWRLHDNSAGRAIVGVSTQPPRGERRIDFRDREGSHEHVISDPTPLHADELGTLLRPAPTSPRGMPLLRRDTIDNMPPFIGLWFCTPE